MLIYNTQNIIPAGTVLNTTRNSIALQLENILCYSIQIVFTGTPTGSFKLQSSCDAVTPANMVVGANGVITYTPAHWTDIANSTFTVAAAGNVTWNWSQNAGYTFVRACYTDTSSGSSTAIITSAVCNAKGA